MFLAVIALNLADFGLVVESRRVWRFQFISATAPAPDRWFHREWRSANDIGCSPAGGLAQVSTGPSSYSQPYASQETWRTPESHRQQR